MAYTNEEKRNIVNRINQGELIRNLCSEHGVSRSTVYRWLSNYDKSASGSGGKDIPTVKEYNILQRRVQKLENIIAILKTVDCTTHASLKEKLTELELLYGQYDVHTLCEALKVPRGTFYNHIHI